MNTYEIKFKYRRIGEEEQIGFFPALAPDLISIKWGAFALFVQEVSQNPYLIDDGDSKHPFTKLELFEVLDVQEIGDIQTMVAQVENENK